MVGQEQFYENPKFWITVAFITLIVLGFRKMKGLLLNALDSRSARIKTELDEARRLREEAEAVLAEYKEKQAHYLKEAENMLQKARQDADALTAHAQAELKESIDARLKHAMERIAQEEQHAIADVRSHVVDISLAAARKVIVDQMGQLSHSELLALALKDIERKIH